MFTVCANELALTKAHVRLEGERHAGARRCVGSCAAAADVRQSRESVEIRDLRRVVNVGQRKGGIERIVMDEDCERSEGRQAPGNRVRAAFIVIISTVWRWTEEPSPRQGAHGRYSTKD